MSPDLVDEQTPGESQEGIPNLSFLIPKSEASTVLGRARRSPMSRGIVCECCYHRCSVRELTQYCAGLPGKRSAPYLSQQPIQSQFALKVKQNQHKPSPWRLRTLKTPKV